MGAAPKAPKNEPVDKSARVGTGIATVRTTLKDGDNVGLDIRNVLGAAVDVHVVQEWLLRDDTTAETGIVTEEDDTKVGRDGEHDWDAR